MLELAILGLLKEQELHGYELKKRLADTLGGARSGVSYGSLYPALGRLEAAGAVSVVEDAGAVATIPFTGSLGGELAAFRARRTTTRGSRGKKVYRITDRGEQLFAELLTAESASGEDERLFNLRLAFARYLPPGARIGMLERRRAHLVDRLGRLSARVRTGRDRLDNYARSLLEHDREAAEHDLSWIDRLLSAERAAAHPAPGGSAPNPSTLSPPGPSPATPSPATPSPATPSPATPSPATPSPATPSSVTPGPVAPGPVTSGRSAATSSTETANRAALAAPTTVGNYRPSLSGLRPRTSEENTTV